MVCIAAFSNVGVDHVSKQRAFVPKAAAAGASAIEVVRGAFGNKGQQLLDCAQLYYAYLAWHNVPVVHTETLDGNARDTVALQLAVTANKTMIRFKAVAKETGKTWVYHVALFIVPHSPHRPQVRCRPAPVPVALTCI